MYDNVALWFAKDINGNIITIDEVKNNQAEYFCPMCGSELVPKAIKTNSVVSSHFAHVDKSKCTGESMIHFWFKNKFIITGDRFKVTSDTEREYVCKEILVEESYDVDSKVYKPDLTVITECGNTIYFEMNYSNKKKVEEYIDIWLGLKNIVVEVDIKSLMNKGHIPVFKALFYNGKCLNVKKNDMYYNTIGKYKEELLKSEINTELKERVRKLDWFWQDIIKYNNGDVDIKHMNDLIESVDEHEYLVITNILGKPKCTKLYNDYQSFAKKQYMEKFNSSFEIIKTKYENKIKIGFHDTFMAKNLTLYAKFKNEEVWESIGSSWGGSYNHFAVLKDLEYVNERAAQQLKHCNKIKERQQIVTNEYLLQALELVNKNNNKKYYTIQLEQIDDDFIYRTYHYSVSLIYKYINNKAFEIDITNCDICRSNDLNKIVEHLTQQVEAYHKNAQPLYDIEKLKLMAENINNDYKILSPIKKVAQTHKKTRIYYLSFDVEFHTSTDEYIRISLKHFNECSFYLRKNILTHSLSDIKFELTKDNHCELNGLIRKLLSDFIRQQRYGTLGGVNNV